MVDASFDLEFVMSPDSNMRDILRDLLERAGERAMARFRHVDARRKADGTRVTDADVESERVIVAGLRQAFPDAGIHGEEGTHQGGGGEVWYVDPIDGTDAYLDELAHWGPTVCLVRDGVLEVGAFWMPRLGEFWYAERDAGAWRNGERLPRSPRWPLGSTSSIFVPSRFHRVTPLDWPGKVRALGSSAAHLAQVAAGNAAATLIPRWALWDVGCGLILLEETGHVVRDLEGRPFSWASSPGMPFLAGDPAAVDLLLERNTFPTGRR